MTPKLRGKLAVKFDSSKSHGQRRPSVFISFGRGSGEDLKSGVQKDGMGPIALGDFRLVGKADPAQGLSGSFPELMNSAKGRPIFQTVFANFLIKDGYGLIFR